MRPFVLNCVLLTLTFAVPVGVCGDESRPGKPDPVIEEFEVLKNGDVLLLPVTIGGETHKFLVDTGSTRTVFDTSLDRLLGSSTGTKSVNGNVKLPTYRAPELRLRSIRPTLGDFVFCMDLRPICEVSDHEIAGILGMDALKELILDIDFDAGRLSIVQSADTRGFSEHPMIYESGMPHVFAIVPQIQTPQFLIDTGASGSVMIAASDFRKLRSAKLIDSVDETLLRTVKGDETAMTGVLNGFALGRFRHAKLAVVARPARYSLGLDYLSRFRIILDFQTGGLYLKPGKRYEEPPPPRVGLVTLKRDGKWVVELVDEGSRAHASGIRKGDFLLKVDGIDVATHSQWQLGRLLTRSSDEVRLTVERDSEIHELRLRPMQDVDKPKQ